VPKRKFTRESKESAAKLVGKQRYTALDDDIERSGSTPVLQNQASQAAVWPLPPP